MKVSTFILNSAEKSTGYRAAILPESRGDGDMTESSGNVRPQFTAMAMRFLRLTVFCVLALAALAGCKKEGPDTTDPPEPPPGPVLPVETITVTMPAAFDAGGSAGHQLLWSTGMGIRVYEVNPETGLVNQRVFTLKSGQATRQGTFGLDPATQDGLVPGKKYMAVWMNSWAHSEMSDGENGSYIKGTYMQEWQKSSIQASSGDWTHIDEDIVLASGQTAIEDENPEFILGYSASVMQFKISSTDPETSGYTLDNLTVEASSPCFITGYVIDGEESKFYNTDSPRSSKLYHYFNTALPLTSEPVNALLLAVWDGAATSPVEATVRIGFGAGSVVSKDFTLQPMEPGKVYSFYYEITGKPIPPVPDPWDGTATRPEYFDEVGKTAYIARPSDLAWLVANLGEYSGFEGYTVTQTADLDLNNLKWDITAWGIDDKKPFRGTYEGGGHTIANLLIDSAQDYSGLFPMIASAVVRDLHIVSGSVTSAKRYTGALCGESLNSEIYDCSNAASVTGNDNCTGGICGFFTATENGKAISCRNTGAITGTGNTGGIAGQCVGKAGDVAAGLISDCVNEGNIACSGSYAGGIFGHNARNGITFTGCRNTGRVSGTGVGGNATVGGIGGTISGGRITSCHNTGEVTTVKTYAAGICGLTTNLQIEDCSNTAPVTGGSYTGGICGSFTNSTGGTITRCLNTGLIQGQRGVGGIAGIGHDQRDDAAAVSISYSVNKGYIVAEEYVGGIFGENTSGGITVTVCRNTGNVFGYINYGVVGGIGGQTSSGNIRSCYSTGLVTSAEEYLGGVCGYISASPIESHLSDNFWLIRTGGAVFGYNKTGNTGCTLFGDGTGITGWPDGDPAKGWGVVDAEHPGGQDGYAWQSMGSWNPGREGRDSQFPLLWWETEI